MALRGRRTLAALIVCALALGLVAAASVLRDDDVPRPRSTNIQIEQRLLRQLGAANGGVARCGIAGGDVRDAWSCDVVGPSSPPEAGSVAGTYLVHDVEGAPLLVEPYPILPLSS